MINPACPDDATLWPAVMGDPLSQELQLHLSICTICQHRVRDLQGDVHRVQNAGGSPPSQESTPDNLESLPQTIGEYAVFSCLGSGGQADVYRAWHPRLRTDVVIKWYRADAFPDAEPSQLNSEAHILSTIRHPHLGQVFDVGIEQGRHFIVMEYISGHTFSSWMRRFKPTLPRMASVLAHAARAVDAVHRHGALHLDLKPGNILVDDDGNPRVIDFGMARLHGYGASRSLLLAPGTPEYMSPEQCAGDASRISEASDVYGLGAVLFSALSQQPVRSENLITLEPDWSLIRHAPWTLRNICRRALAVHPRDRYESAAAFAKDLDRFAHQHAFIRRGISVAMILAGITSCFIGWVSGMVSHSKAPANLLVHSQRQQMRGGNDYYELHCEAVLAERRLPCLMLATATTDPIYVPELDITDEADLRIGTMNTQRASLRIADDAGPALILTSPRRSTMLPTADALNHMLMSLDEIPRSQSIEILLSNQSVSLITNERPGVISEATPPQLAALSKVRDIQNKLNTLMISFSGIVVIPPRPPQRPTL